MSKRSKVLAQTAKLKEEAQKKKEISTPALPSFESVAEELMHKLSVQENVADLVMVSMAFLPDQMPSEFQSCYRPISAAGTSVQIKTLARMLTVQLNEAGLLSYNETIPSKLIITIDDLDNDDDLDNEENEFGNSNSKLPLNIKAEKFEPKLEPMDMKPLKSLPRHNSNTVATPTKPLVPRKASHSKVFRLSEVTANVAAGLTSQSLDEMLFKTYNRILNSEG